MALAALPRLHDILRAADQLLRSGAFGLVVLDLERAGSEEELSRGARRFAGRGGAMGGRGGEFMAPLAVQVRLANLCQRHDATLLCLTESKGFVLSGIRGETRREREREGFRCSVDVVKDKKNGGAWEWGGRFRGPVGLR